MLYEIDSFGFLWGYITKDWRVMSKMDLLQDKKLRTELERVEYEERERHNIDELLKQYKTLGNNTIEFEKFCRTVYNKSL